MIETIIQKKLLFSLMLYVYCCRNSFNLELFGVMNETENERTHTRYRNLLQLSIQYKVGLADWLPIPHQFFDNPKRPARK